MLICEIGQNYCGDLDLALHLIAKARDFGGDLVKFQLFDSMALYDDDKHPSPDKEQAKMLFDYGAEIGIEVFFSVLDVERVKWCEGIGVKRYKIPSNPRSDDVVNAILQCGKPVISSFWSVALFKYPLRDFLYCIPHYPALLGEYNLVDFSYYSGISDHTIGLECAKRAVKEGAKIVEKHFSLRHNMGVDGAWSMTPVELRDLKDWWNVCQETL